MDEVTRARLHHHVVGGRFVLLFGRHVGPEQETGMDMQKKCGRITGWAALKGLYAVVIWDIVAYRLLGLYT